MRLNTIRFYIILKLTNRWIKMFIQFEYYTFLHHSQTNFHYLIRIFPFEYYTFLHHSQTARISLLASFTFEYYTFLHHSQTSYHKPIKFFLFEYYTFLHHSQTSEDCSDALIGLNTIRFYIILKPIDVKTDHVEV